MAVFPTSQPIGIGSVMPEIEMFWRCKDTC